jgi:citrate synthase
VDNETLTITDNRTQKAYTVPIFRGTVRAMDLRQIKTSPDDFGLMTYDPAFMNTASCHSAITYLDGEKGILRYRGYPIEQLAEHCTFLEVAYLLLNGELPTRDELDAWNARIMRHTMIHENLKKFMDGFHHDAHPMGILLSTVAALSTFYPDARNVHDPKCRNTQIVRLIGKLPTLAAYAYRHRLGRPYIYPDPELCYAKNYMNMLWKKTEPKYVANPVLARALEVLFILHADHEQNCSTSVMRAVGSSDADPYATTAAAISALWGPLHGGANEEVLRMLDEIGSKDRIPAFIEHVKDGKHKLMGFGHRVYKNYDPRARIIKQRGRRSVRGYGAQPQDRHRPGTGEDRSERRVFREAQTVSQRGFLLGDHLPGDGIHARSVHRAVRHPANRGLAGPMAGIDVRPGQEDRPSSADLHRRRAARLCADYPSRPARAGRRVAPVFGRVCIAGPALRGWAFFLRGAVIKSASLALWRTSPKICMMPSARAESRSRPR